jgi:hypothetical protein
MQQHVEQNNVLSAKSSCNSSVAIVLAFTITMIIAKVVGTMSTMIEMIITKLVDT